MNLPLDRPLFIVEDDLFSQKIITKIFEKKGFTDIHVFNTGEHCFNQMMLHPGLVVLDHNLNEDGSLWSGLETYQEIRTKNKTVPIIMLSGQEDTMLILKMARLGLTHYVVKNEHMSQDIDEVLSIIFTKKSN